MLVLDHPGVEQADEVVVVERCQDALLGLLAGDVDDARVEELHGDGAVQALVPGVVHDGHAASADDLLEPVPAGQQSGVLPGCVRRGHASSSSVGASRVA